MGPEVIIAGNHDEVSVADFVVALQHLVSYALVVLQGLPIGASDDDGLVESGACVFIVEAFDKSGAGDRNHVGEGIGGESWQRGRSGVVNEMPDGGGIEEYARRLVLSHDLGKRKFGRAESGGEESVEVEGGRVVLSDGRELRIIADEQHPASVAAVDKRDEVVEESSRAEGSFGVAAVGDHRSLVDDKKSVRGEVLSESERGFAETLLSVDFLMNGIGRRASVGSHDLGGASGGSEQRGSLSEKSMARMSAAMTDVLPVPA